MRFIQIFILFVVFFLSQHVLAEIDVNYDVGFRTRYLNFINSSAVEEAQDGEARVETQGLLGLTLQKGETLLTKGVFSYASQFGKNQTPSESTDNLLVNQFYGWWKSSDSLSIWFGRFDIDLGDRKVFSKNSYQQTPYAYDGARFGFLTDFAEFDLYLVKLAELEEGDISGFTSEDPENRVYFLNVDFKSMPEALNKANLIFVQLIRDEVQDANTPFPTTPKQNFQHLSFNISGKYSVMNYSLSVAQQYGQQKGKDASQNNFDQVFSGNMVDMEWGIHLRDFYQLKFWLGYHRDSGGEDDSTQGQDVNTYQTLFYDIHENAGRMDVLRWGNLSYYRSGLSMKFLDEAQFGMEVFVFEKTNEAGDINISTDFNLAEGSTLGEGVNLGSELDLWYHQAFDSGLQGQIRFSFFKPDKVFEKASTAAERTVFQLMVLAQFEF